MKYTILFGGKAGQGPNMLSEVVSEGLINRGYYVFYSRDYQSLIRGGHNFNTLTFSDKPVHSNNSEINILVCLDDNTERVHKSGLNKKALILKGEKTNAYFAGVLFKLLGLDFRDLEHNFRNIKNFDSNIREARLGFNDEKRNLGLTKINSGASSKFMNGNQAIAKGAIASGLNFYYSYPMTPATPLMMELGQLELDKSNKHRAIEMESEISVINTALGSSLVGSKSMVGTSGGGFDLMTESLSLSGMAEIPIVIYLSQRPGPSTGVATYTSQADLNLARFSGHGEFSRVVIAPGDIKESAEKTSECFYLSQKFRIPCILIGDKHLGESKGTFEGDFKIIESPKSITKPERFNSYESDKNQNMIATEDAKVIAKNAEYRLKKHEEIGREAQVFEQHKVYGNKNSKNIILSWGSTKGAILDAIDDFNLDIKFIQVLYIEPFSTKIKEELKNSKKILVAENNSTSQLSKLMAEKTNIIIEDKNKILKYDGRPFFSDEIAQEILRRLK